MKCALGSIAAGYMTGRALAGLVALSLATGAWSVPGSAQGIGSSFETYQANTDAPIDIEADVLEVDDKQKQAVFKGNVVARQAGFSLKAKELAVYYAGQPSGDIASANADAGGANGRIRRIEAKGKVLVTTNDDQSATSEWANFDVEQQIVTIGGNVVLSQGENVLRGDRLVIDLQSGKSRFEVAGESGKQRIRGLFQPNQD
jgi:lipopolysaccharide export system protein LptA